MFFCLSYYDNEQSFPIRSLATTGHEMEKFIKSERSQGILFLVKENEQC